MKVHVFEFVPAAKANNEVNNHKSRKSRKKAAKRSTTLRARENDRQSTVPASLETVTMLVSDYQKLTSRLSNAEEIIKRNVHRYNNLELLYNNALSLIDEKNTEIDNLDENYRSAVKAIENKNNEIEKFNNDNINTFNNLNRAIAIQNKEIAKLKAIIKDLKGTVITMCDSVK